MRWSVMKIRSLKAGSLNSEDRLALATLLVKAGYTVKIDKETTGKRTEYYVEATGDLEVEHD